MRRAVFPILVVLALVIGMPAGAHAASNDALNRSVSGTVAGTVTRGFAPDCFIVTFTFDLTVTTAKPHNGSLTVDECIVFLSCGPPGPDCVFVRFGVGTFTFTLPSGAALTGTAQDSEEGNDVEIAMTVTSGTRSFKHVTGTLDLTGTFGTITNDTIAFTGTLTSNLAK